jgi:ubiquinone/menaquinone biosynthesis C-methylase UbiE
VDRVLNYGCGPGAFSLLAAERTGPPGRVYALDIHPLAIQMAERRAQEKRLVNVETILSAESIFLGDASADVVLFFDVFHMLDNQEKMLAELHRVLKPGASMYFSVHHLKAEKILGRLQANQWFRLKARSKLAYCFSRSA